MDCEVKIKWNVYMYTTDCNRESHIICHIVYKILSTYTFKRIALSIYYKVQHTSATTILRNVLIHNPSLLSALKCGKSNIVSNTAFIYILISWSTTISIATKNRFHQLGVCQRLRYDRVRAMIFEVG